MFERFTKAARDVVALAQDEAREMRHNYLGTEHLLLGLLREEEGLAAQVLASLEITVEQVRTQVAGIVGEGEKVNAGQIPFTPRAKRVLDLARQEARQLADGNIGTEHILLGLVHENEGVAARILLDADADPWTVRAKVLEALGHSSSQPARRRRPALAGRLRVGGALGAGLVIGWAVRGLRRGH
ncbi:MAG TPA: Clp protease N-terminal domain-containing protein [Gaiellaceae bacterium]|nr:Clp protease N-terminal domain-containing protein [Gaiellaceae bacterium]